MSRKEQIKEYEQGQMDKLEKLGLVRHMNYNVFTKPVIKTVWKDGESKLIEVRVPDPQPVSGYVGNYHIIAETIVELYDKKSFESLVQQRKDGKIKEHPRDLLKPVGIGVARCSSKDQYDKRVGRLKATNRAIQSFINSDCMSQNQVR